MRPGAFFLLLLFFFSATEREYINANTLLVEHIEIMLGVGAASKEREGIDPR